MSRVLWITGLPASGKTTLARALVAVLEREGIRATLVDSDEVRAVLTPHPSYEPNERAIVYRALAYLARRIDETGVVPIVAATAHSRSIRDEARTICDGFFLVHTRASLAVCEARDPKHLYRQARAQTGGTMPGVHVAYDAPADADIDVDTATGSPEAGAKGVVDALRTHAPEIWLAQPRQST
jgi:adenylylsulfate kinase-like enzyme